jgi:undecaprenyl diphosphate synthase
LFERTCRDTLLSSWTAMVAGPSVADCRVSKVTVVVFSPCRCMVEEASRMGLEQLTLYCFSSENWKRPPRELTLLMALLRQYLIEERREIQRQGLRFRVIGTISELDPAIQQEIARTEEVATGNVGMTLCLAVNYWRSAGDNSRRTGDRCRC